MQAIRALPFSRRLLTAHHFRVFDQRKRFSWKRAAGWMQQQLSRDTQLMHVIVHGRSAATSARIAPFPTDHISRVHPVTCIDSTADLPKHEQAFQSAGAERPARCRPALNHHSIEMIGRRVLKGAARSGEATSTLVRGRMRTRSCDLEGKTGFYQPYSGSLTAYGHHCATKKEQRAVAIFGEKRDDSSS